MLRSFDDLGLILSFPRWRRRNVALSNSVPRFWGAWQHEQNIQVLEARALVMLLQRVALILHGRGRSANSHRRQSWSLSLFRPVSEQDFCVNMCFRQLYPCKKFEPTVRWVPPEFNNSD